MWPCRRAAVDGQTYQAMVELHRIRRRFDLAWLKFELQRDGVAARRALQAELRQLSEQERKP